MSLYKMQSGASSRYSTIFFDVFAMCAVTVLLAIFQ
jgi:hypothetical protein